MTELKDETEFQIPSTGAVKEAGSSFAQRLRIAMADQSVLSFAKKCEISDSLVRKYLHGTLPGLGKLVVLAKAGNVRVGWLATGEMPMVEGEMVSPQLVPTSEGRQAAHSQTTYPINGASLSKLLPQLDVLENVITKTKLLLQERSIDLEPAAEARVIRLIYEFSIRQGGVMDEATLNNIIELAAFR